MSALQLVPDLLPAPAVVHHPSCPVQAGTTPCICPPATTPIEDEQCPDCSSSVAVWKLFSSSGWTEWLACAVCTWREQL